MFVPVKITSSGVEYAPLERFGESVRDMREPLTLIGERIRANVEAAFNTEGASGDRPWVQLKDGYRQWKESKVAGLPILIGVKADGAKGTRTSPQPKTYSRSGRMREEMIAADTLTVGRNKVVYAPLSEIAVYHQEGTPKMAARPPVVITIRELGEWDKIFASWVSGMLGKVTL